jgi:hypothetical protein
MPSKSLEDLKAIDLVIAQGWSFCPKKVYKEYFKTAEKEQPKVKTEKVVKEKKEKNVTEKYGRKKTSRK